MYKTTFAEKSPRVKQKSREKQRKAEKSLETAYNWLDAAMGMRANADYRTLFSEESARLIVQRAEGFSVIDWLGFFLCYNKSDK